METNPKKILGKALLEAAAADERIVLVSADSGPNSGFSSFISQYPERFFECGIMEPTAVSICSGLATTGAIPIFCAPAPFAVGRAYEMFRIDVGYMRQNVKIIGRNAGFSYSDLGPTHYGLDDIALVRMIPGVRIFAPQDAYELEDAFRAMLAYDGPCYMRVCNADMPPLQEPGKFAVGRGSMYARGGDAAILATGNKTAAAVEAAGLLRSEGIFVTVAGFPTIVPLDTKLLLEIAENTKLIFTVEEHFVSGGFGTVVSEYLSDQRPAQINRLGLPNDYVTSGDYDEMTAYYGLDAEGIAATVKKTLQHK